MYFLVLNIIFNVSLVLFSISITTLDFSEAYEEASKKKKHQPALPLVEFEIPEQFICPLCKEIMTDAVKTDCCATHFCDSCELWIYCYY